MDKRIESMCKNEYYFETIKIFVHQKEKNDMQNVILDISFYNPYLAVSCYLTSEYDEKFEERLYFRLTKNFLLLLSRKKTSSDELISFFLAFHLLKDFDYASVVCNIIFDPENLNESSPYWFTKLYSTMLNHIEKYFFYLRALITTNEQRSVPSDNCFERDILVRGMRRFIDEPPDPEDSIYPFRLIRMIADCGLYVEFAKYVDYDLNSLIKAIDCINKKSIQYGQDLLSTQKSEINNYYNKKNWNILYKFLLAYLLNPKGNEMLCSYDGVSSPILSEMLLKLSEIGPESALRIIHLKDEKLDKLMQESWNIKRNGFNSPYFLCFCYSSSIPLEYCDDSEIYWPWWVSPDGHEWTMTVKYAKNISFKHRNEKSTYFNNRKKNNKKFCIGTQSSTMNILRHYVRVFHNRTGKGTGKGTGNGFVFSYLIDAIYNYSIYRDFWNLVDYDIEWLNYIFATVSEQNKALAISDYEDCAFQSTEKINTKPKEDVIKESCDLLPEQWIKLYRFIWFFLIKRTTAEDILKQHGENLNPVLKAVLNNIIALGLKPDSQVHFSDYDTDEAFQRMWDPNENVASKPFVMLVTASEIPPAHYFSHTDLQNIKNIKFNWRCRENSKHRWEKTICEMIQEKFKCPKCTNKRRIVKK